MVKYTTRGKTPDQVLADFEAGNMDADYGANTVEYMQASLAAAIARSQERWVKIAALAACASTVAAIAAVIIALVR